jgi:hypothetical protein
MKLNSVNIMEKTIIILKPYVCKMRKFDTDYRNVFDDYVYYVICHWEGWRVELRGLLIIYVCVYSWVELIPDRFTFVRTAYIFIWQTGHWWYQPSLSWNHRQFDVCRQSQCNAVYHVSWLKCLNSVQIIHTTRLAYIEIVWECTRSTSHKCSKIKFEWRHETG